MNDVTIPIFSMEDNNYIYQMKSSESIKYAVTFKFNKTIPNSMMQRMLYTYLARKEKKKSIKNISL